MGTALQVSAFTLTFGFQKLICCWEQLVKYSLLLSTFALKVDTCFYRCINTAETSMLFQINLSGSVVLMVGYR